MKKIFLSLIAFFLITLSCFAGNKERSPVGLQFALGSGFPLYGDKAVWNNLDKMNANHFNRIILYGDFGITVKLADKIFFLGSVDSMFDFNWQNDYKANLLDYAFGVGIQVYPGWGNLSLALSYELGLRYDFITLNETYSSCSTPKWGNGFCLAVEYDILSGGGVIPVVGTSYRLMPRGDNVCDNIVSLYLRLAFR